MDTTVAEVQKAQSDLERRILEQLQMFEQQYGENSLGHIAIHRHNGSISSSTFGHISTVTIPVLFSGLKPK